MRPAALGAGRRYRTSDLLGEDRLGTLWAGFDGWTGGSVVIRIVADRLTTDQPRVHQTSGRLRRLQGVSSRHLPALLDHDLRRLGGPPALLVYDPSRRTLA